MNTGSLGDMAQGQLLRNRSAALKQDMQRLNAELTSGQITDVRQRLAGNYSFLTDAARKMDVLESYRVATSEASQFAGAMQLAMGNFSTVAENLSGDLIAASSSSSGLNPPQIASDARSALDGLMGSLNLTSAGRSLFSGNATNQRPLVDTDTLLTDLSTAIAGATTPEDMIIAATAWFDDPGGFAATAYQGSTDSLSAFALSPNESATLDIRADDPGFREALKGAALAALADDPAFGLSVADQTELFAQVGEDMLVSQSQIIGLQSKVGFAEARIDAVTSRNAAEASSLTIARNSLLEADPFETATKLEEVQFQLQSLYSVTVRMSQLSLVNYL